MKTIGILYICTGKYKIFWKDFYESIERFFLVDYSKTYFIFTDDFSYFENFKNRSNFIITYEKQREWPYPTLLRFETFKQRSQDLKSMDYLFFFNANMLCVSDIAPEILPNDSQKLVVVLHPGFYDSNHEAFTYDRNSQSTAYIPTGEGKYYFMGGLNGGKSKDYLEMIHTLSKNINIDLKNGIIALWHDESHLNHYMLDKAPKILTPSYGYPQGLHLPFEKKIVIRDKNKYGGHDFLRDKKLRFFDKVIARIKYIFSDLKRVNRIQKSF